MNRTKTVGIACVSAESRKHNGCALDEELLRLVKRKLFSDGFRIECAKVYAICIYLLIKDRLAEIDQLIICYDEDFTYVKAYLLILLSSETTFSIINIRDLRRILQKNISSLADKYANHYRKRALKKRKWIKGSALHVVEVNYDIIERYWNSLK